MIGWKRIVVTVGEKIGKEHLNYGQGASAELVAMGTIGLADWFGLPVSTTHVLSSGIAGTMAANRSGLQANTLRNIILAWVLTLPICVLLGATLFSFSLYILLHVLACDDGPPLSETTGAGEGTLSPCLPRSCEVYCSREIETCFPSVNPLTCPPSRA